MEIIQEIGSYAGFAAVLGLAVLSALYFSQARDVKRLREWAGRAPERTVPPVQPQRVVAQPIPRPPQPAQGGRTLPPVPRPPGPQPGVATPAAAAATGAAPAVAKGPAPATPAAAGSNATEAEDSAEPDVTAMDTVVHPPPSLQGAEAHGDGPSTDEDDHEPDVATGGPDATAAGGAEVDARGAEAAGDAQEEPEPEAAEVGSKDDHGDDPGDELEGDTGEWAPEDEHSELDFTDEHDVVPATPAASAVRPPQPPRPLPRRPVPPPRYGRGERTGILPPYEESRPGVDEDAAKPSRDGRRTVLLALAALVAVAVGAFAVLQLTGGDGDSGSTSEDTAGLSARQTSGGGDGGADTAAPIDPSSVTVAVLNGTTVPGLAAQIGDQITGEGFQLGTVTNNFDQERAESVVLFAPGAEREAADVGRRLGVSQREEIDPDSQSLAGDATVVVVAGADQTQ